MLDLDSVWVQLKTLHSNSFHRCRWKTKFLGTSSGRIFRTPSIRISHHIFIVRTSCRKFHARVGIFCLLVDVVYRPWGLKFVYPTINLAFLEITVKDKLLAKFCLKFRIIFSSNRWRKIFFFSSPRHWDRGLIVVIVLCFDLLTRSKMPFKVMHRKEVTHSNGSYERKSCGRKLADEMGRG